MIYNSDERLKADIQYVFKTSFQCIKIGLINCIPIVTFFAILFCFYLLCYISIYIHVYPYCLSNESHSGTVIV